MCLPLYLLITGLCKHPSHAAVAWYSPRWAASPPGGMRRTQKGIITFLPKHRNSMNYLRYTRRAPRQLRDRTTQDSVRELRGQGPAEEPGGISGDPEVTSEGKLNDKKQKEGVGSGEWERTFIHRFGECVYAHASIYHGYRTHTHTQAQINLHRNTHSQEPHRWFTRIHCKHTVLTHINRYLRIYLISCRIPHTLSRTRTPQPSSISGFRAVPPSSPRLCFWLCLHAGRRSPDTHHWVSSLHINATYSPIKSPICASVPLLQLQSSYKIPSSLYVCKWRLGVNHGSSWRIFSSSIFFFFLFWTRRSDVLFVTVPCFHLNADWLGSQLKHIPCSRTTLDIPLGFFSSGFLCFLCRVLHRRPAFKAKNKHWEFTWGGGGRGDWGFTSKILTNNLLTYVGHSQKKQGDPLRLLVVLNEIRAWNSVGVFVRDTQRSLHCAKLIEWLNVAKKKKNYFKNWLGAKFIRGLSLWHFSILIYYRQVCPHNMQ